MDSEIQNFMVAEKETASEWTSASVKHSRLNPLRDEANRRKKNRLPKSSFRDVVDDALRLGTDALRNSRNS